MSYNSLNFSKSLAKVIGSHETYTILWGLISFKYFIVLSSNPLLGGSIIIESIFSLKLSITFATSLQINSILSILFNSLFFLASPTAYLFISTETTFLT